MDQFKEPTLENQDDEGHNLVEEERDDQNIRIEDLAVNVKFPIYVMTSADVSSMNDVNSISAESFHRYQQWKPGLKMIECWLNDEVG